MNPPGYATRPYGEICPLTRPFFFTSLSNSLQKFPYMKKFIPSLKGPRKGASLHVIQKREPYGNRRQLPEPYLAYLSGSPVKDPPHPLQVPSQSSVRERCPIPRALHLSKSPLYDPPSRPPSGAPMERDARLQSLVYVSCRVPSKGARLQIPLTERPWREMLRFQSPPTISEFPVNGLPPPPPHPNAS